MSRAALLAAGPDPFLLGFWLRHYRTWADQVDVLRIIVCGQDDPALRAYTEAQIAAVPHAVLAEFAPVLDHGVALRRLMDTTTEDLVCLLEDDSWVLHPGAMGEQFARIEGGETDLVGCPRATATTALTELGIRRFGQLQAPATGEAGPLFWPCFLWAKRADLERTDRHYGAIGWRPGATILGETFDEAQSADTFGWASLQLRAMGVRCAVEANFRADLRAMTDWNDPPWLHAGGLSTGWGMYVMGPPGGHSVAHLRGTDQTDWTKRVAWWQRFAETGTDLVHLRPAYRKSIAALMAEMGMDQRQVDEWREQFDRLVPSWT